MARTSWVKTIKVLFGQARRCAFPGCDVALVFEDRGELTVIAEIAHIRSAKPKGPRHDPGYPPELLNEPENLLLLCNLHHKPVDEHATRYSIEELLRWKADQIADGPSRELSDLQASRIFRHYELDALSPAGFEQVCTILAAQMLDLKAEIVPLGQALGYDAAFEGRASSYPCTREPWDGLIFLEAVYSSRKDIPGRVSYLRTKIARRFDDWFRTGKLQKRPDYAIFATNISLATMPDRGQAVIDLLNTLAQQFGLRGVEIWDEERITRLLESFPEVRLVVHTLTASNDLLNSVLGRATTAPTAGPVARLPVRPGEPGHEAQFQAAYDAVGGIARLGLAMGEVQEHELGRVQYFAGGPLGEPAILCERYGHGVVAVSQEVWNDIASIGSGVPGGGTAGVGFPVGSLGAPGGYLSSTVETVNLAGGSWSPTGQLLRPRGAQARWRPAIAFDSEAFKDRDAWSALSDVFDLRVRLAARIPLAGNEWRVSSAARNRVLGSADVSNLARLLTQIARDHGIADELGTWQELGEPAGRNNSRFAAYHMTHEPSSDGRAVEARLHLMMPDRFTAQLHTAVDLRLDFGSGDLRTAEAPATPLSLARLLEYLSMAWPVAMRGLLTAAAEDPLTLPLSGAPRTEIYIQSGRSSPQAANASVLKLIDLSELGSPRRAELDTLSVGVSSPLDLTEAEITDVVKRATVWMVEDAGFAAPPNQA